jgi:hypothetical protein
MTPSNDPVRPFRAGATYRDPKTRDWGFSFIDANGVEYQVVAVWYHEPAADFAMEMLVKGSHYE